MTFSIRYKPLFEVKILHHFFLDKGTVDFFSMTENDQDKQLADFDISTLFELVPSAGTQRKLAGHKLLFKATKTGFAVWSRVSEESEVTPFIELDDTLELTFLLRLVDHRFFNYTNVDMANGGKLFYFSNKRPDGENPAFPLIKKDNNNNAINDNYCLSNAEQLSELGNLSMNEKDRLFAMVRIHMKADNGSLDITTNQQKFQDPYRVFHIIFKNRETFWRYFFRSDQQVNNQDDVKKEDGNKRQLVTRSQHPLTLNGFISIELGGVELPNPDANLVKPNSANNKIYSEIYM